MSDDKTPNITFYSRTDKMLDILPDFVKDPKNYKKIQMALLETLSCKKSHSDAIEMAECKKCTENMLVRRELLKKFGFTSSAQYMAWRKVHEEIKKRVPLDMYNRIVSKK